MTRPARLTSPCSSTFATPGCFGSVGAIDVLGLELLVDRIFLVNLHDGEYFTGLRVDERDLLFGMDAIGKVFVLREV